MKKVLFLLLGLVFFQITFAQAYTGNGDQKINAGITAYGYGLGIKGTYDFGIHDYFSVGAGGEIYFDEDDDNEDRNFYAFLRANAHLGELLQLPWELDVYPGVDLGLTGDGIGVGGYLGARYFFSKSWGVFAELGTRGSFGITYNF